jgi:hypothetical protein
MAHPRIWFDPPAFSWGRVLRIGALWFALVLVLLAPLLMPADEERRPPVPSVEPGALLVQQPAGALHGASAPATAVAVRGASGPAAVASGPSIAR